MRTLARTVLTGSVAALMALTSGTAHARGSGPDITVHTWGDHGKATFKTYGDHLYITDLEKDGRSVVAIVDRGSLYYYWNKNGAGTTVHRNLNLPEGVAVAVRVCTANWQGSPSKGIHYETCRQKTTYA
ncbi:hypothetical protein GCM10010252_49980 [Streptomyces aureoverticillatus]|nr:hypothetical protein GCM10010252_49980 [Streptomyces aureoverticillatus]